MSDSDNTTESTPSSARATASHDVHRTPADLKVRIADQALHIVWNDGESSDFPFHLLRRRCPCATCMTERDAPKPLLPILKSHASGEIRVTGAQLVGHYAIQFSWSDGHDSGIYDFRFLRALHDEMNHRAG